MGLIPEDIVDEIRSKADIVQIIGEHVQLRKAGQNHKGVCPFHHEKTPSFNVNGAKGFFYCFGCQKKGDVFTFLMEYHGKSFVEAAKDLAGRYGIEVPERAPSPAEQRARSLQSKLFEVNRIAHAFFRASLADDALGERGRAYLRERAIGGDIADRFELGYAPDSWDALVDHLRARKVPPELAVRVGLVKERERRGGYYSRWVDRVVCPVFMPGGEIAGFSGRRLGTDEDRKGPKYFNSPESEVYKKSRLLYGLTQAREGFRRAGRAVVVEGNFDVVNLHQAGFDECVATLGTALTDEHVAVLRRLVPEVVVLYDDDRAGRAAALNCLKALAAADVPCRIATLPDGHDPDSLVRSEGGPERLATLLSRAQPGVEYFIHEVWSTSRDSADSRAAAIGEAAELIRTVDDRTKRDLITGTLATALGVDVSLVRRAVARSSEPRPRAQAPRSRGPVPTGELKILAILADHPNLMEAAEEHKVFSLLTDGRLRDMYSAQREGRPMLDALPADADPKIAEQLLEGAFANVEKPEETLKNACKELQSQRQLAEDKQLRSEAEAARRRGDLEREREIFRQIVTRRQVD